MQVRTSSGDRATNNEFLTGAVRELEYGAVYEPRGYLYPCT